MKKLLLYSLIFMLGCDQSSHSISTDTQLWPNGNKKTELVREDKMLISHKGWYEDGKLKFEFFNISEDTIVVYDTTSESYLEKVVVSRYEKRFHQLGYLEYEGELVKSKRVGKWLFYDSSAKTIEVKFYNNGEEVKDKVY